MVLRLLRSSILVIAVVVSVGLAATATTATATTTAANRGGGATHRDNGTSSGRRLNPRGRLLTTSERLYQDFMLPHNSNNQNPNHAQDRPHRGLKQTKTEEEDGGDYDFDDAQFNDDDDADISLSDDDYGYGDDDDYNGGADDDDDATTNNNSNSNNNNNGGGGGGGGGKNKNKDKNGGGGNENDGAPGVGVVKEDDDVYGFDDAQFNDDDDDISTGDYYYGSGGNDDDDTTTTSVKDEAGDEEDYVYEPSSLGTAPSELGLSPPSPAAVTTTPPTTNLQPTEGVLTPEFPADDTNTTTTLIETTNTTASEADATTTTTEATIGLDADGLVESTPTGSVVIELFLVVPETTGNAVMNDEEFDNKLVNTVYEVLFEKLPSGQLPTQKDDNDEIVLTRKVRRLRERSTRNNRNYPSPRGSSNITTDSTLTRTFCGDVVIHNQLADRMYELEAAMMELCTVLDGMLGNFNENEDDLMEALDGMLRAKYFNEDDLIDALNGMVGDFNEDDLNDALGSILGDLNNVLNDMSGDYFHYCDVYDDVDAPIGWYSSGDSMCAYDVEGVNIESTTNVINCADADPMLLGKMMEQNDNATLPVGSVCIESIITFDSISNMYSGTDLEKLKTDVATTIATGVFQEELVSSGIEVVGVYYPNGPLIDITADDPPELVVPVVSTQNSTTGEAIVSSTIAPTFLTPVVAPTLAPVEYIDPCSKLGGDCDGCLTQDGCLWCVAESFCFNSNPPDPDGTFQQSCGGTITGSKQVCKKLTTLPPTKEPTPSPTTRYPTISPATTIPPFPEQDDAHGDGDSHDDAVDDPPLEVQATEQQDEDGAYSLPSSLMNTIVLGICTSSMILLLSFYQN